MFDDTKALDWILNQNDDDAIEELTSPMIEKLIREVKNIVVLFCKYAGYMLIALTHTCYMLRHYTGASTATSVVNTRLIVPSEPPTGEHPIGEHPPLSNGDIWVENQRPGTYLPAERVKGLAMES